MTVLAAALTGSFGAMAVDSVAVREKGDAPVNKIKRLVGSTFASVIGSEFVIDAANFLAVWAEECGGSVRFDNDVGVENLQKTVSLLGEIYAEKNWRIQKQNTTLVTLNPGSISITDLTFKSGYDFTVAQSTVPEGQIYVNHGGTSSFDYFEANDLEEARTKLIAKMKSHDELAKLMKRPLPYELGNVFSFVGVPKNPLEAFTNIGPFSSFTEWIAAHTGCGVKSRLFSDRSLRWNPTL